MKWGILATGTIAKKFASTVEQMGAEGGAACCRGLTAHGKRTGVCAAVRHPPLHSYEALAADPEVIRCPVDINGFEYEIREASPQDSLALTRLMYDIRMSWGMKFAGEV